MNFFNIGFSELMVVLVIMLIFLGPHRMTSAAYRFARFLRKIMRSDTWRNFFDIYKEIKQYPSQIMQEVNMEEIKKELRDIQQKTDNEIQKINQEINPQKINLQETEQSRETNAESQQEPSAAHIDPEKIHDQ
ncbi:MAG: hypothetical protein GYA26_04545 [Flexilinea flocculi]|jgi:Sec-independent protein translocase protein TatA|nr:hypothetical protein [Flexilinea flocculi]